MKNKVIEYQDIRNKIRTIRGLQVMPDRDLAEYGVKIKRLNEKIKRNISLFFEGFCFKLTNERKPNWSKIAAGLTVEIFSGCVIKP